MKVEKAGNKKSILLPGLGSVCISTCWYVISISFPKEPLSQVTAPVEPLRGSQGSSAGGNMAPSNHTIHIQYLLMY